MSGPFVLQLKDRLKFLGKERVHLNTIIHTGAAVFNSILKISSGYIQGYAQFFHNYPSLFLYFSYIISKNKKLNKSEVIKLKKILSFALVCVMLLSMICLTGCDNTDAVLPTEGDTVNSENNVSPTDSTGATKPDADDNNNVIWFATDKMIDDIIAKDETSVVFHFSNRQSHGTYMLKNSDGEIVVECHIDNDFTYLAIAHPDIVPCEYTLWCGNDQYYGIKVDGAHNVFNSDIVDAAINDTDDYQSFLDDIKDKLDNSAGDKEKNEKADEAVNNKENKGDKLPADTTQPSMEGAENSDVTSEIEDALEGAIGGIKDAIENIDGMFDDASAVFVVNDGDNYFYSLFVRRENEESETDPDDYFSDEVTPPSGWEGGGLISDGWPNNDDIIPGPGNNHDGGSTQENEDDAILTDVTNSLNEVMSDAQNRFQNANWFDWGKEKHPENITNFKEDVLSLGLSNDIETAVKAIREKILQIGDPRTPTGNSDALGYMQKFRAKLENGLALV